MNWFHGVNLAAEPTLYIYIQHGCFVMIFRSERQTSNDIRAMETQSMTLFSNRHAVSSVAWIVTSFFAAVIHSAS